MSSAVLEEKTIEKVAKISENQILDMLWREKGKPKNYLKIKVVNVFDNAYRVNVWSEFEDEIYKINRVRISHSYFCKVVDQELLVI